MLTVWRRLHIEIDSMGLVFGNSVAGEVPNERQIRRNETTILDVTVPSPLEVDRFENGKLFVGGRSLSVECIAIPFMCNTASTVRVKNTGQYLIQIPAESDFDLYDDDDFNDDDSTFLNGDFTEDIPMPDMSLLSAASDNPDVSQPNTNIFAKAYIHPVYDIGDNNNSVPFVLNPVTELAADLRAIFDIDYKDGINTDTNPLFWTVYVLGGYQSVATDDNDPDQENGVFGTVDAITGVTGEGTGALVYFENHRPRERPGYTSDKANPKSLANTVAHEISHLFSCLHGDGELMGNSDGTIFSSNLSATMISKIRKRTHP